MKKKKSCHLLKRAAAVLLALTVFFTTMMQGVTVLAAAESEPILHDNLVGNPGFEPEDPDFSSDSYDGVWHNELGAVKQGDTAGSHTGTGSALLTNPGCLLEQDIKDLKKGITYTLSIWAKADNVDAGNKLNFGIKNYGGAEVSVTVDSTEWKEYTIEFLCTTETVRIYAWLEQNTEGNKFYMDDVSLIAKNDLKQVTAENGSIKGIFKDGYTGQPAADEFTISYSSSLNPQEIRPVTIVDSEQTNSVFSMNFDAITAQPAAQTITMYIEYVPDGQSFTLDFPIAASGEAEVVAGIQSLTASNGLLTAVLDKTPTAAPKAEDFAVSYKIGEGDYQKAAVTEAVYTMADNKVEFTYERLPASGESQAVVLKVNYRGQETFADFTIDSAFGGEMTFGADAASGGRTFYIAASGNDTNDGLSPETAFLTIDHLNTIVFQPGDHILFHKGDVFKGGFKPQGSGIEGAPIVISSYGAANQRAVLQPADGFEEDYVMTADTNGRDKRKINNGISFVNQEYWEVRDIELYNPLTNGGPTDVSSSQPNYRVYERGINLRGTNAGELQHMYFDNLVIHGFHGTRDNLSKSSGGILMEVQAVPGTPAADSVPTSINDIRITNCEMYDLGLSGINFVTVWARRAETTDTKWGPYPNNHGVAWPNYTRTPYKDFYLGNNYFHEIDGDACIVDTCDDAVVEHNLVYSTKENAWMAVGLFNWNSNNTTFQYNEVYGVHGGSDGQGIEIDALNDTTYVQYNYLHDNAGGSLMYCCNDKLYGFDGIYRYNIFQNDGREHGVLDLRMGAVNSQCYNNTFYMKDEGVEGTQAFIPNTWADSKVKMYNNIFYYAGETPFQADGFMEGTLEWKTNVFYNFANVPSGETNSNITENPMLADPGTGGTGTTRPIDFASLSGYALKEGSPAIDAGTPIKGNGGQDLFGNPVSGVPDVGAYESGSAGLKIASELYGIDHTKKTVFIMDDHERTAKALLENLTADTGATIAIYHDAAQLSGETAVVQGDTIRVSNGTRTSVYTVKIAYEPELLVLTSDTYVLDQKLKTIEVPDEVITVGALIANLSASPKAELKVYHGAKLLSETDNISIGDKIEVSARGFIQNYYITLAVGASSDAKDLPIAGMTASAGSQETVGEDNKAANVLDNNPATIWHTLWAGTPRENLWIQIDMSQSAMIDGVRGLPRSETTGTTITKYLIQYSMDGTTFQDVPGGTGSWESSGWQAARFLPVEAKAIRLCVVDSMTAPDKLMASLAEMRLTGAAKPTGSVPKPTAPSEVRIDEETVTTDSAMIRWNAVADTNVMGYAVTVNQSRAREAGTTYYVPDRRINFYILSNLTEGTDYNVLVEAVSSTGERSEVASTSFTTKGTADTETPTVPENMALGRINETKAALSWDSSSDNTGVSGYEVAVIENGTEGESIISNTTETGITLTGLTGGRSYTATVRAVDANSNKSAVNSISFTTADKTSLRTLEQEAAELEKKLTSYPDGAEKDAFTAALLKARNTIADEDAQAEDIQSAYDELGASMERLTGIPVVKKDALAALAATARGYDLNKYVDGAGKDAFINALAEAEYVLVNGVTQERTDQAYAVLQDAMSKLVKRADKSLLQEWVTWGRQFDLKPYTQDSAAVFKKALEAAEKLLAQDLGESRQGEINAAIKDMEAAYNNLKKIGADNPGTKPNDNTKPNTKPNTSTNPKTGDNANMAFFLLLIAAATVTAVSAVKKSGIIRRHR